CWGLYAYVGRARRCDFGYPRPDHRSPYLECARPRGIASPLLSIARGSRSDRWVRDLRVRSRYTRSGPPLEGLVSPRSPGSRGDMEDHLLRELLRLEHRGWQALCDGNGAEFYGAIMTDDAVMILAHGQALDRDAVVASLEHAPPWDSYAISAPTVRTLETDVA